MSVLLDSACLEWNSTKQRRLLPMTKGIHSTALSDYLSVSNEQLLTHEGYEYTYVIYRRVSVSDCACGM